MKDLRTETQKHALICISGHSSNDFERLEKDGTFAFLNFRLGLKLFSHFTSRFVVSY